MELQKDNSWEAVVQEYAAASEELGKLHPAILEQAYKENWFKLFVPKIYGGAGKQLPEILRLEEQLAAADGSLGWIVTLCAGAAWFAGFLDPALATTVFADEKVCFAGSGAVGGTAIKTDDGYIINGHWKYASGALHATIFTANCKVVDGNGANNAQSDGNAEVLSFILKKEEVKVLEGWAYFGLVATGSHAFEVKNLLVPFNRSFKINEDIKIANDGFDYPFLQLAETTLAVNSLGMCNHFLALVKDVFLSRSGLNRFSKAELQLFEELLTSSLQEIEQVRTAFYNALDESWSQLIANKAIEEGKLFEVSDTSRKLVHACWRNVQKLYPYCGLEAANKHSEINRVFRDVHTASQHALLTFEKSY
ncbi:alkylation response protein AidB-like acyl-CoA dehydrogenase [Pedobacter sp. UYP30]|uniref:acyl-CoA dehydrogenase n=1 Tax=Pedobacter sp. UYP30 TaxID=1756400 RepID=UPI00339313C3